MLVLHLMVRYADTYEEYKQDEFIPTYPNKERM